PPLARHLAPVCDRRKSAAFCGDHSVCAVARLSLLHCMAVATAFSASTWAADWTVGANVGNVPWEFQDAKGEIVGFEVDVVKEVAKRAGKTVEFVNIPFNGLFSAVQSKRADIA
nr:hypothetical protein [Tanacetum cinerariifolium]